MHLKHSTKEHDTQVACVSWFRYQYPEYLIYAIPNGAERHIAVGKKLKLEGVLSGVPDLHIPVARQGFHGLYIEMKAGKNTAKRQLSIIEKLRNEGYKCEICYSLDEFINVINNYLK